MTAKEKAAQQMILGEINKAMDLLEGHFKKFCAETNGTAVPMNYISNSIKVLKENMAKGAEKAS